MKNIRFVPDRLVPTKTRLSVYKQALKLIYKFPNRKYGLKTPQLCLLLPCILWGLDDFMNEAPNGETWCFFNTKYMFPEMKGIEKATDLQSEERKMKIREEYLLNAIKRLTI